MNDNTTAKPGVLEVMDKATTAAIGERDMHDDNDNKPMADYWEELRAELREARATVERLAVAASSLADDYCRMVEGERSDDPHSDPGYPEYKSFCSALRAFNGEQS